MILSIAGALLSAFAVPLNSGDSSSVFVFLSVTRLILGVGVGGVYPLAATVAAESSSGENRGRSVALVFSMQGIGTVMVPIVGMIFLYSFGTYESRHADGKALAGISWRLILGIGALPGIILMPFQKMPRSSASEEVSGRMTLLEALRLRKYWRNLLGCAGGWFLFDITFYGNTLFAPTVLESVFHTGKGGTPVIGDTIQTNLCWQLLILGLIGLPGYYYSVWMMDSVGRKAIQLHGFIFMAALYGILGASLDSLSNEPALLLLIYGLTYFFSNFGPNSTTFILPSESFPFEVRSSLNGFCAAAGKVGATLGSATFKPMVTSYGSGTVFYCCSVCALLGVLVTIFCIDDRRGQAMEGDDTQLTEAREDTSCQMSSDRAVLS